MCPVFLLGSQAYLELVYLTSQHLMKNPCPYSDQIVLSSWCSLASWEVATGPKAYGFQSESSHLSTGARSQGAYLVFSTRRTEGTQLPKNSSFPKKNLGEGWLLHVDVCCTCCWGGFYFSFFFFGGGGLMSKFQTNGPDGRKGY